MVQEHIKNTYICIVTHKKKYNSKIKEYTDTLKPSAAMQEYK